jgi:hypothetical protein
MPFDVVFWHWWSLGAILLIVELLVPGMFFIWMGESAFVVGAVVWLFPAMSFEHQVLLFSAVSPHEPDPDRPAAAQPARRAVRGPRLHPGRTHRQRSRQDSRR